LYICGAHNSDEIIASLLQLD